MNKSTWWGIYTGGHRCTSRTVLVLLGLSGSILIAVLVPEIHVVAYMSSRYPNTLNLSCYPVQKSSIYPANDPKQRDDVNHDNAYGTPNLDKQLTSSSDATLPTSSPTTLGTSPSHAISTSRHLSTFPSFHTSRAQSLSLISQHR